MHVCAFLGVEEPWSLSHLRYTEWLQRPAIVGDLGSVETEKQGSHSLRLLLLLIARD